MKNFYLTTTLPYVNAEPHIGFALEIIQADVIARYHKLLGEEVVFNTGTDEHGLKIYRKAEELGIDPQKYCDEYAAKFDALKQALNLSYTNFIRTTDVHHIKAAQEFWKLCEKNGDIYKKKYQGLYCIGCEAFKTEKDLVNGICPDHPTPPSTIITLEEENYFFKFSKYQKPLLEMYEKSEDFVIPENRLHEIRNFVEKGLEDFSVSRMVEKMPWGIPVPGDEKQVMYVWFDALINYISTLGWPEDKINFEKFWPGVQVAGKDNLRQQTAMWQAMLMSAGLSTSKQVFIHGHITSEGQKMSKSIGNVVAPYTIVDKYGVDAVRYYLLGALSAYNDGDFSIERFEEFYTAHLVNGVGNLTSRILTMIEKYSVSKVPEIEKLSPPQRDPASRRWENLKLFENLKFKIKNFWEIYDKYIGEYRFDEIVAEINKQIANLDQEISQTKPWEKAKNGEDISGLLYQLAEGLRHIAVALLPIIPGTAENILKQLGTEDLSHDWGKLKEGGIITKGQILFPRLEK